MCWHTHIAQGVTEIYLHTPVGFSSDPAYGTFVDDAINIGVGVHAIAGDATWAKNSDDMLAWVDEVIQAGGYSGLVADIEPYLLKEWTNLRRRARLVSSYLNGPVETEARSGVFFIRAAIPFW